MIKFPNKLYSIKESVLFQMIQILQAQETGNMSVPELFVKSKLDIASFIDAMDCLYTIRYIEIDADNLIHICFKK